MDIVLQTIISEFQERPLNTLKILSGFFYLTLYDYPKRPIGKWERGPKAASTGSIQVWGRVWTLIANALIFSRFQG